MAPPPPARVRDRSADLGTTYARADTRVYANSSEVLSDVQSIPLLVDLSLGASLSLARMVGTEPLVLSNLLLHSWSDL